MNQPKFNANSTELVDALTSALNKAFNNLGFDVRCIDWLSYTPDFFIEQYNKKAA